MTQTSRPVAGTSASGRDLGTRRALVGVGTAFAAHALQAGSLGPWIPSLKDRADIGAGGLGVALTTIAAGLLIGTRVAPPLLRRMGARRTIRIAVPLLAAVFAVLPTAAGLGRLMAVFACLGFVSGVLDVGMNDAAVQVEVRARRRVMSGVHGTWSVATLAGAALATVTISLGVSFGVYALALALLIGVGSVPLLRWLPHPETASPGAARGDGSADEPDSRWAVIALCSMGAAAFLVEGSALEWSAVYLRDDLGVSIGAAGLGVVAFTAGMAASRFVGDRLATRFRPSVVVRVGAWIGASALALGLLLGGSVATVVALAVLGLSMGPVVPLVLSAAGRIVRRPGRSALAVVVTSSYVGSVMGPAILGATARIAGLRLALVLPVIAAIVIAAFAGWTDPSSERTA
ncbi:MAG: MFS transporter [Actinomycetota bacterium]